MSTDCPSCAQPFQTIGGATVCPSCESGWPVAVPAASAIGPRWPDRRQEWAGRPLPASRRATATFTPVAIAFACLMLATGLIAARTAVVRALPRVAGLYAAAGLPVNVRGLAWADVHTAWPDEGTARVAVSGRIRNVAAKRVAVPRLAFDLRDAAGSVLASWSERPAKRSLAAHETLVFATQSRSVPKGATEVVVRFTDDDGERPLVAAAE